MHAARQRCLEALETLAIQPPFTIDRLIREVARVLRRPIALVGADLDGTTPCGLLVTTDDLDLILYPNSAAELHRRHIIAHEIGHLLLGHTGTQESHYAAARRLAPDLPPGLISRLLGRTTYADRQEREAEHFATLLQAHATRHPDTAPIRPDTPTAWLSSVFDPDAWAAAA